ncbi:hypothetical protein B0H65DRAFT_432601 [Neurospora tetraspora]|uniref:Zn(2)-C6 fungal-type domain-containing protein n=1 Tax=Neurospora tetraspora TaxID=94610 RepID=A0AAE0J8I5_9PEZI|nr:hypothetical protein B0H65DRAFT_432601 [Neurospora tetraspora]
MAQRRTVEAIQSRPSTPQPQDSSLSEPHPDQSAQDEGKHRHHLQQKLRSPAPQPDQEKPQPLPGPSPSASPAPALLVPQPSSAGSAQAQTLSSTPGTATTATSTATTTSTTSTPDLQQPSKDASSATTCTPPVEIVETGAGQSITTSTHQDPRAPSETAPPLADTVSGQHQQYNQQQIGAPHNGSAPRVLVPTPMSHPQQPPSPPTPRQTPTMNYPAPSPYPPAGMPPGAQYAYGAQAVAHVDPYRTNQTALPSMRTFDHVQQQHPQHQMPLPNHMTVSMAPNQMSYYAPMHPAYQMHPGQSVVHYALTGLTPDPRIALSGGRHKKEIKRRTKTGCLTCRKRRIKCDEAHPACNNCKKSKRDCLGYDPIFKQQQQQQQQQHQQNLTAQSTPKSQHSAPASLTSTPTVPSSSVPPSPYQSQAQPYQQQSPPPHHYHQQSQQHLPAYQHQPHPTSYPPSHSSNTPYESPVSSTSPGFDYGSAIDPALSGTDTPSASGTPTPNSQLARPDDRNFGTKTVDDLIALGGAEPPIMNSPPSQAVIQEIKKLYGEIYVTGLSYFFETQWYDLKYDRGILAHHSIQVLLNNQPLMGLFGSFVEHISQPRADHKYASQLEECIVWGLAKLPLCTRGRGNNSTLTENPLCNPMVLGDLNTSRRNELEFWWYLAELAIRKPNRDLQNLRRLLDGQENRDFLYSLAVLREYSHHWNPANIEQQLPSQLAESDPRCRLAVAARFIRTAMEEGTTNVVRRFAQLAYRAYVHPGASLPANAAWRYEQESD